MNNKGKEHRENSTSKGNFKKYEKRYPAKRNEGKHQKTENNTKRNIFKKNNSEKESHFSNNNIRLNKYISNSGICSRRRADEFISLGEVRVNDNIITELGFKVKPGDKVYFNDQLLNIEKPVYILLNKPKGFITTMDDPLERKTVMELVKEASKYRIFPVGRLDRNTSGLLLFTNDGNIADKLTHPKHNIEKLYHIHLDKNLKSEDFRKIQEGISLDDGFIKPDEVSYIEGRKKNEVGISIHSGKNRIIRRIFEHLGYDIIKLDRCIYAGLTKKDLPRGKWRYLNEKEIGYLKRLSR